MAALDVSVDESLSSEEQPTTPKTAKEGCCGDCQNSSRGVHGSAFLKGCAEVHCQKGIRRRASVGWVVSEILFDGVPSTRKSPRKTLGGLVRSTYVYQEAMRVVRRWRACSSRSVSDIPPQMPYGSATVSAWLRHCIRTGH